MTDLPMEPHNNSEFILYVSEDGTTSINVRLIDETVWLSQKQMAELFQKDVRTINEHIQNVYKEGELVKEATIRNFRIVQKEGSRDVSREIEFYNLDVIISVGYRVRSYRGTQFRQWATQRLREYIIKGYVLDKKRLKEPGGIDYFDQLLEDIREIRASEKRFYLKIRDIYATSVDYNSQSDMTRKFFQIVQNKMLWAVAGQTAAEIIYNRADSDRQNMGLKSWEKQKIRKADISIAKNYLEKNEIDQLNRIVTMYLDFAELQAINRVEMTMNQWVKKLDGFLSLNDREILSHSGKISKELADAKATEEYLKYDQKRRQMELLKAEDNFDIEVKKIEKYKDDKDVEEK